MKALGGGAGRDVNLPVCCVMPRSPRDGCSACGRGFYKSSSQDLQCSRCPAHSFNDREGSWRCDCDDGYYRALSDPPSVACTSESRLPSLGQATAALVGT
ncbi:Ephrin type-A receptor 7 [Liparis tanakae]|uniref:Ephrin type-A receptor 7 n=1 Tax=Liparis tanakae TaxID=230148 RepID=A0A4Z2HV38_9TELE|nr:Ephrin type-A receptor 7 [Liparis tanakae]